MDLRCKKGHLFGNYVDVDGVRVDVGEDGIARDVPEETADVLLRNTGGWAKHVEEAAQPAAPKPKPKAPAAPPPKAPTEKKDEPSAPTTASAPASSDKPKKDESKKTSKKSTTSKVEDVLGLGGKDEE